MSDNSNLLDHAFFVYPVTITVSEWVEFNVPLNNTSFRRSLSTQLIALVVTTKGNWKFHYFAMSPPGSFTTTLDDLYVLPAWHFALHLWNTRTYRCLWMFCHWMANYKPSDMWRNIQRGSKSYWHRNVQRCKMSRWLIVQVVKRPGGELQSSETSMNHNQTQPTENTYSQRTLTQINWW